VVVLPTPSFALVEGRVIVVVGLLAFVVDIVRIRDGPAWADEAAREEVVGFVMATDESEVMLLLCRSVLD